jgi:hypothetical protein
VKAKLEWQVMIIKLECDWESRTGWNDREGKPGWNDRESRTGWNDREGKLGRKRDQEYDRI